MTERNEFNPSKEEEITNIIEHLIDDNILHQRTENNLSVYDIVHDTIKGFDDINSKEDTLELIKRLSKNLEYYDKHYHHLKDELNQAILALQEYKLNSK